MNIGVVAALPREIAMWVSPARIGMVYGLPLDHGLVACSGMGATAACNAAERLLSQGVRGLVSWGCAGAIAPEVRPGTLCLPGQVQDQAGGVWQTHGSWRAALAERWHAPCSSAPMLGVEDVVTTGAQKQILYRRYGCVAVDMESLAIAQVAQQACVPFLVVRAVADSAHMAIPESLSQLLDAQGKVSTTQVLRLVLAPGMWPALVGLGMGFSRSMASLRRVSGVPALWQWGL